MCPPWYEASSACIRCDGPHRRWCTRGEQRLGARSSGLPTAPGAPSPRSCARRLGQPARSLAPSVHPAYDDLRSSSLPFDRLTLDTNHLGGRWPFFLAPHRFTEVYGHNHPRQVPVRHLGDNDGLRCVFTHRSSSTFSVVAGRIATCCACAAGKPLIGDAARPSRLASQNLSRTRARRKTCQSTKQAVYWPTFGYRCRSVRPTEMPRLTQATPRDHGV